MLTLCFSLYPYKNTYNMQLWKEITFKQCTGFVIYEDLLICRMEEIENLKFKISCYNIIFI